MKKNVIAMVIVSMLFLSSFMIAPAFGDGPSPPNIIIENPIPHDGQTDVPLSQPNVSAYVAVYAIPRSGMRNTFNWEIGENDGGNYIIKTNSTGVYGIPIYVKADLTGLTSNLKISWYVKVDSLDGSKTVNYSFTTINELPVANFTCLISHLTVSFTSTSFDPDGGNIINSTWEFGDGTMDYGTNVQHSYLNFGAYKVNLTVKDDDGGATGHIQKSIEIVDVPPIADFTYVLNDLTATFTSNSTDPDGGNIINSTWDFGDGSLLGYGASVQHVYSDGTTSRGTYNVKLTVKDDDGGAIGEITKPVKVVNNPPVARFSYSIKPSTKTVSFDATNSSDVNGTIVSYFWKFGDGTNGTGKTIDHAYAQDYKTYNVTLKVTDSAASYNVTFKYVTIADVTKPTVKIVQPVVKGIYKNNVFKRSRLFGIPLIIGGITLAVNASDVNGSGIAKVDFYINNKLKGNDTSSPYSYNWSKDRIRLFHVFTIKVVAYDKAGNSATAKMIVRKFL